MTGVQIEYFFGVYFAVSSLGYANGKLQADILKILIGIVLILLAHFGFSFI